jgi:hypothetical protein
LITYLKNRVVTTINFGVGGNGIDYEIYGWHLPEPGFTWTKGGESCLRFPKYDAPFGVFVELDVSPQTWPGSPDRQPMSISANGIVVGGLTLTKKSLTAIYVPPLDYTARGLMLTIYPDKCGSEASNVPARSIAFTRVRVMVLEEPMPARSARSSSVTATEPRVASTVTSLSLKDLVSKFESLGTNCEVGFVQRISGAEPLGLLRFAAIPLSRLVDAIDANFAGLDQADNLKPEGKEGWDIRDDIYNLFYHTARRCDAISADNLRHSEARRLRFLIRKFMGNLAAPEKIFVWWQNTPVTQSEILPLFLALRRRGPVTMLWVDRDQPTGMVEEIWPGLLRGRIAAFSQDGGEPNPQRSLSYWIEVMTNSWLLTSQDLLS